MSKIGVYQPEDKHKSYNLPTGKPQRSHSFYQEKIWTLQEQIFKKLNTVAKLLLNLYPKLTDTFSINIKGVIESNLKTLIDDLEFLKGGLDKDPSAFNTNNLKTNQMRIDEMKHVCDTLQTVSTYEYEFKNLGKIKHALHELEHLIQPSRFQISLNETQARINKAEKAAAKQTPARVAKNTTKVKIAVKVAVKPKKKKNVKPKDKSVNKLTKPVKKASKPAAKAKASVKKAKPAVKKTVKAKAKAPAKKKSVATKAKPKAKAKAATKKKSAK